MKTAETLPLLYRDDALVVVHKPSGLLVHRTALDRWERRFALQILRDQIGQKVFPVHRLDKATSGILIFALSSEVARTMSEMFAGTLIHKEYRAIVRGHAVPYVLVDHPLKEEIDSYADPLASLDREEQSALTEVRGLEWFELPLQVDKYATSRYSLVECRPKTGRRHQIRRHLRRLNHPIVGDSTYGAGVHNRYFRRHFDNDRLLLACTAMSFAHPVTGEHLSIECAPSDDFLRVHDLLAGMSSSLQGPLVGSPMSFEGQKDLSPP